jgi:hypothetical protein
MTEKEQAIYDAVQRINEELDKKWRKRGHDMRPTVICTFGSHIQVIAISLCSRTISFQEICLWCSVDDDRIYYEKSDKYETWYQLIKRKWRIAKDEVNMIKL